MPAGNANARNLIRIFCGRLSIILCINSRRWAFAYVLAVSLKLVSMHNTTLKQQSTFPLPTPYRLGLVRVKVIVITVVVVSFELQIPYPVWQTIVRL